MIEIEPKVDFRESKDNKFGKLVIEPLERGHGTTLGNALRRILLSSLEGVAITHVKIEGVRHEFSTIPGVVEDVTEIILNLKKVRFNLKTEENKVLYLDASLKNEDIRKRGGVVTAADIAPDAEVEVLTPEQVIATLDNEDTELKMELEISRGKGYIPAERQVSEGQILDRIPIDSIFSPIRKVNYIVEDTRVGQVTNYDKLVLEVWTNGSVAPHEAVSNSAQILNQYLKFFVDLKPPEEPEEEEPQKKDDDILDKSIDELGLSVRSLNCLKRAGKKTLRDLTEAEEPELMKLKNFGQKSLEEVKSILDAYEFSLKEPEI
ncbi:MAG: DNA-directed RNA polymerase subunit alpha [Vulcanimicrobiota bacterium]